MAQLTLFSDYDQPHALYRLVYSKLLGVIDEWVMDFDTRWDAEQYIKKHRLENHYYVAKCSRDNGTLDDNIDFEHLIV